MSFLYAVGFGGIVAFGVYLPAYLRTAYGLEQADAALRAAGFILVAVLARPVGGWLSDRYGPVRVLVVSFSVVALAAVVQAFQPPLMPIGTIALLTTAAMLGAAAGAVFALVAIVAPARAVGAVTGVVGAAGGLGGFIPPLIMGAVFGAEGSYAIGLMLLSDIALAAAVYTAVRMSRRLPARSGSGD
jgi:NNP family nitrate/nitrite transporter-like MFS transporter